MSAENNGELVVVHEKAVMQWSESEVQLIHDTIAKDTTPEEFKLFLYQAKRTGLDPLAKQIYVVKRWNSQLGRKEATIQVGIDGYRTVAERSGGFAGVDAPIFEWKDDNKAIPYSATVSVYRIIQGQRVSFTATVWYDEYVQTTKGGEPTSFWRRMPRNQLAKCAEAAALRKAFPHDLSGIYTTEEMQQADNETGQAEPATQPKPKPTIEDASDEELDKAIEKIQNKAMKLGVFEAVAHMLNAYNKVIGKPLDDMGRDEKITWYKEVKHRIEEKKKEAA